MRRSSRNYVLIYAMVGAQWSFAAHGQGTDGAADQISQPVDVNDIVVTARKREETSLAVPVSISAMGENQIKNTSIMNAKDIALRIPSVNINASVGAAGGIIFIRGVGSQVSAGAGVDNSVSFDIDGVPASRGNLLRVGTFDLQQIQILKGPQALFFGKNSSAGVISLTSKDPGDTLDLDITSGYEPFANTRFVEGGISLPMTDALGIRIFSHYMKTDGTDRNLASQALGANAIIPNVVFAPSSNRAYRTKEAFFRGTVVWKPSSRLTLRLKGSYDDRSADGPASLRERIYCPQGKAQSAQLANAYSPGAQAAALAAALSVDDCKVNGTVYEGNINPANLLRPGFPKDDDGLYLSKTKLFSADLSYDLADTLSLNMVSGYVDIDDLFYDNFTFSPASPKAVTTGATFGHWQFTQEVRLQTALPGRFDFMAGGFYQKAQTSYASVSESTAPFNTPQFKIPNQVFSGFGQAIFRITDSIELAGGARYTHESKRDRLFRDGVELDIPFAKATYNNVSPEATLTYRPTQKMTIYGAYKTGFKSGGYNPPIELPPFRWTIEYDGNHQERDVVCRRRSTSPRRSSGSCVRSRSCWARAGQPPRVAGGSVSRSRPTTGGARNMAV